MATKTKKQTSKAPRTRKAAAKAAPDVQLPAAPEAVKTPIVAVEAAPVVADAPKGKPAAAAAKPAGKQPRVTILGHSAMAVLRWMGKNGWTTAAAAQAVAALGEGGELKPSSISTGLSDGRSGKWGAPAPVTAAQAKQLEKAAKGAPTKDKPAAG